MKFVINAQLTPGRGAGGVETVLAALISALGRLEGNDEYVVVASKEGQDWLRPLVGPNQHIVVPPSPAPSRYAFAKRVIRSGIRRLNSLSAKQESRFFLPVSDGFFESLGGNAIHFPYQSYTICSIPSIFSPHDLQHRHFPEFFKAGELAAREELYRLACHFAQRIVVASHWVKSDLIEQYSIAPSRIQVIPLAPPTAVFAAPTAKFAAEIRQTFGLTRPFILYPSMTWPHKNHVRLVQAISNIDGLDLVCTGFQNDYFPVIQREVDALGLKNRVRFLGMVPGEALRALYQLCEFVVIPTLFESTSEPIFEAWEAGRGVICSSVTALPEQTSGAAILFNPFSVAQIKEAIERMVREKSRFESLGRARLQCFSWEKSARAYRTLYRSVAGVELDNSDHQILASDWMKPPKELAA